MLTFLRAEPEHERLQDAVESDEADVREVDEVPLLDARELGRHERRAHRADPVDGVHHAHLDGRVTIEPRQESVRARVLGGAAG